MAQEKVSTATLAGLKRERIVFCLDLHKEMDEVMVKGKIEGTRLEWLKSLLSRFFQMKHSLNPRHEFAIVCLTDTSVWYMDFTSDYQVFSRFLRDLETLDGFPATFDMSSLFKLLLEQAGKLDNGTILRSVLFYGRSKILPVCSLEDPALKQLLQNPSFAFDAVYLHEKSSAENNIQDIYDLIVSLETQILPSYFFETTKSLKRLTMAVMQLMALPGQRPEQKGGEFLFPEKTV